MNLGFPANVCGKLSAFCPETSPDIVTVGTPPECFSFIKEECEVSQAVNTEVDYMIEVPLRVCESLCGYVTDRTIEGIGEKPFYELDSIEATESEMTPASEPSSIRIAKKSWFSWFQTE